jgi:hypothetical protein
LVSYAMLIYHTNMREINKAKTTKQ